MRAWLTILVFACSAVPMLGCGDDDTGEVSLDAGKDAGLVVDASTAVDASTHPVVDSGKKPDSDDIDAGGEPDDVPAGPPPNADELCGADRETAEEDNLVYNGGFELPMVPVGTYQLHAVKSMVVGWTVIGEKGNVAPLSEDFVDGAFEFKAHSGDQTLDLTGLTNTETGISQDIKTKKGQAYALSFWIGNVVDSTGYYGDSSKTNVSIDGKEVLVAVNSDGKGKNEPTWKRFCVAFTAKSDSTTIDFINGDPSSDNSNLLDDVFLQ